MPRCHVPCIYNWLSHCYMTPLCPSCIIMLTGLLNCSNMWCLLCDMCRNYGVGVEVGVRMTRRCPTEQRTYRDHTFTLQIRCCHRYLQHTHADTGPRTQVSWVQREEARAQTICKFLIYILGYLIYIPSCWRFHAWARVPQLWSQSVRRCR